MTAETNDPSADAESFPFQYEEALRRFGGDRELFEEMVELFFSDVPRAMAQLRTALDGHDWSTVARIAHSLKGTVGYFGVTSIVECARGVEQAAKAHDAAQMPAAAARLERAIKSLRVSLAPYRSGGLASL